MFFCLISQAWDKEKIVSSHEALNLGPQNSAFRCSTTEPQRLHGEQGHYKVHRRYVSCILLGSAMSMASCSVNRIRKLQCVIYELRIGPFSPQSLSGSVVEHRGAESEVLRFNSSQGVRIFSLSHACDKMKNIYLYLILYNGYFTLK